MIAPTTVNNPIDEEFDFLILALDLSIIFANDLSLVEAI